MKKEYLIVTKKISAIGSFAGKTNTFSEDELKSLQEQRFSKDVGAFTPSQFKVSAGFGMKEAGISLSTEMFFESVPNKFVDVSLDKWHFDKESRSIPIIIPRSYLNLYNFGFAQSRSLPKLSEGVMGLIQMDIVIKGNGRLEQYKGNIVGFSNRLNTILVPEDFMKWANSEFADENKPQPVRLIVEVDNPADDGIAAIFKKRVTRLKMITGCRKKNLFLKTHTGIVMGVGLFISILSFYILMLSIFLLLQKNTVKLESLLLIGYSPAKVAIPYQVLTLGLNLIVLALSIGIVMYMRGMYTEVLTQLFPQMEMSIMWPAYVAGIILFSLVSVINIIAIRKKIASIWLHKS
jgi:hypothetical protein